MSWPVEIVVPAGTPDTVADAAAEAATVWGRVLTGPAAPHRGIAGTHVNVSVQPLGDNGVLAAGDATGRRPAGLERGGLLPWRARVRLNAQFVDQAVDHGMLVRVLAHEIGHALGFGPLFSLKGLVGGPSGGPLFVGAQVAAEWAATVADPGEGAPLADTGPKRWRASHWHPGVFAGELMSGVCDRDDPAVRLSRFTVLAMGDLGYDINIDTADDYTPTVPETVAQD